MLYTLTGINIRKSVSCAYAGMLGVHVYLCVILYVQVEENC